MDIDQNQEEITPDALQKELDLLWKDLYFHQDLIKKIEVLNTNTRYQINKFRDLLKHITDESSKDAKKDQSKK